MRIFIFTMILLFPIAILAQIVVYSPAITTIGTVGVKQGKSDKKITANSKVTIDYDELDKELKIYGKIDTVIDLSSLQDSLIFVRVNTDYMKYLPDMGSFISAEVVDYETGWNETVFLDEYGENVRTRLSIGIIGALPTYSSASGFVNGATNDINGIGIGGLGIVVESMISNEIGLNASWSGFDSRDPMNRNNPRFITTQNTVSVLPFYRFNNLIDDTGIRIGAGAKYIYNIGLNDNHLSQFLRFDDTFSYQADIAFDINLNNNLYFVFGLNASYADILLAGVNPSNIIDNDIFENNIGFNLYGQFSFLLW